MTHSARAFVLYVWVCEPQTYIYIYTKKKQASPLYVCTRSYKVAIMIFFSYMCECVLYESKQMQTITTERMNKTKKKKNKKKSIILC